MRCCVLFVFLSCVFILVMYLESLSKGMPVKRWMLLGGVLGPIAWCLFNVHYRRAFVRHVGRQSCGWRP
nr:hypothetical protein [Pseudoalteromonas sp. CnMc7-37]